VGTKSYQFIQAKVQVKSSGLEFTFVAAYGLHTMQDRVKLWEDLRCLIVNAQRPVLCMGNYNAILRANDRPQGSPVQDIEVKDFNEFILDAGMNIDNSWWHVYLD